MRTFIAIELPPTIQQSIHQRQQQLEAQLAAAQLGRLIQWTPPSKVHLTLRFLGETTDQQCQFLQQALPPLMAKHKPFTLTLTQLGGFPRLSAPNIIWLGLQTTVETLLLLQQQIEQLVRTAGFAPETKAFTPHLTIGRLGRTVTRLQSKQVGQVLVDARQAPEKLPPHGMHFTVNAITHIQSQLHPSGAVYTALQAFPLTGL